VTRTVTRSLLVSIGVAALLAGCGSASAGSAAVVGGRRISVGDVQSATVDAQTWVGSGTQISQTQVLYLLAIAPYVQEIATRHAAGASVDEARKALVARVPNPSDAAITVIRANISLTDMTQRLGEAKTAQALGEATKRLSADGFTVNPRFGDFDPTTGRITPILPNWLPGTGSQTAPSPTPSQ
jgi:hypothetical protein